MRLPTTITLGVIALIFSFVIYFVDREPEIGSRAASSAKVLARYDADKMDTIEISRGDSLTLIKKQDGLWFFAGERLDRLEPSAVAMLLDQVNHLTIMDTIEPEEISQDTALSRESLGLDKKTAIELKIRGSGEKSENGAGAVVLIGAPTPKANSVYARLPGDENVYVVDGNPRRFLENPESALRQRELLSVPVESIVQLVIRTSKGEVALQRKITEPKVDWSILRPIKAWANKDQVDKLLSALSGLSIEKTLPDSPGPLNLPNPLPDDALVIQLVVFGMEQPITMYLKKEGEETGDPSKSALIARVSDRPLTYRLVSDILDTMPTGADALRDRSLARIPIQALDSIAIQSKVDPLVYLQAERLNQGIRWDVKIGEKLVPANLAQITALVDGINESAIINFVSDSAADIVEYGLDPPARRIIFKVLQLGPPDDQGNPGQLQEVVRSLKLGWRAGDEERLFANFDGEPHIYELDPSFVNLFPTHPIKWRSLRVLSFEPFHLKSISRKLPGKDELELVYDYKVDTWTGTRAGVNISSSLDIGSVRALRDRLGDFIAAGWYLSLAQAYQALEEPSAVFTMVTLEFDPARGDSREVTRVLKLAPSPADFYFGQVDGSPDVFYIDSETYKNLIKPVTSATRIETK